MVLLVAIVILAISFDFINGFHDTANAIATAVSTKAIPLKYAIYMAAVMNFLGAIVFTGVAETIAKDIVDIGALKDGSTVLVAALMTAIIWNIITWLFGIPSSSSHALIGALVGSAIGDTGANAIHIAGLTKIIITLVIAPVIAILTGYIVFTIFKFLFKNANSHRANNIFRKAQVITAAMQAFSHGSNDAQKSMGIISMALLSYGVIDYLHVPFWVQLTCAFSMAMGTSIGGWRIIKTVGTGIMKLKPVNGVAADLSSVIVMQIATHLNLPVSTTHVISSSIMGVGASQRRKGVKWATGRKMVLAWFITIPITIIFAYLLFHLIYLIF